MKKPKIKPKGGNLKLLELFLNKRVQIELDDRVDIANAAGSTDLVNTQIVGSIVNYDEYFIYMGEKDQTLFALPINRVIYITLHEEQELEEIPTSSKTTLN